MTADSGASLRRSKHGAQFMRLLEQVFQFQLRHNLTLDQHLQPENSLVCFLNDYAYLCNPLSFRPCTARCPVIRRHCSTAPQKLFAQDLRIGSVRQRPINPDHTNSERLRSIAKLLLLRTHRLQITNLPDYQITKSCKHRQLPDTAGLKRARVSFQVVFKFLPELFHERDRRHRCRISKRAEGSSEHVFRQVLDIIDVFLDAASGMESLQSLPQPVCPFAARDAPSAALMLIELHGSQGELHDASGLIQNYHAAGTEHRA